MSATSERPWPIALSTRAVPSGRPRPRNEVSSAPTSDVTARLKRRTRATGSSIYLTLVRYNFLSIGRGAPSSLHLSSVSRPLPPAGYFAWGCFQLFWLRRRLAVACSAARGRLDQSCDRLACLPPAAQIPLRSTPLRPAGIGGPDARSPRRPP